MTDEQPDDNTGDAESGVDDAGSDGGPGRDVPIPDDHPLHGKKHLLDTHEGHLEAYSEVLAEADPDEVDSVMLVMSKMDGTDTLPSVAADANAEMTSWLMLAAHISHVANAHEAHPVDVAQHAVHVLMDQNGGGPVDGF